MRVYRLGLNKTFDTYLQNFVKKALGKKGSFVQLLYETKDTYVFDILHEHVYFMFHVCNVLIHMNNFI